MQKLGTINTERTEKRIWKTQFEKEHLQRKKKTMPCEPQQETMIPPVCWPAMHSEWQDPVNHQIARQMWPPQVHPCQATSSTHWNTVSETHLWAKISARTPWWGVSCLGTIKTKSEKQQYSLALPKYMKLFPSKTRYARKNAWWKRFEPKRTTEKMFLLIKNGKPISWKQKLFWFLVLLFLLFLVEFLLLGNPPIKTPHSPNPPKKKAHQWATKELCKTGDTLGHCFHQPDRCTLAAHSTKANCILWDMAASTCGDWVDFTNRALIW